MVGRSGEALNPEITRSPAFQGVVPTSVRSTLGRRTASLVRGVDTHGHWDPDPEPTRDRDPEILAHMRAASARYHDRSVAQEAEPERGS